MYVAWAEDDGVNEELRVARLNASGTAWETVASDGFSPINVSSTETALYPSLTNVGGVPYVSWAEWDGTNYQIRVARLNSTGTAWEKVGQTSNPGAPINFNPNASALEPSLTSVGGVPYVAWTGVRRDKLRDPRGPAQPVRDRLAAGRQWHVPYQPGAGPKC